MKLTVENLGPIQSGAIDLAPPLVLITGPNNQGKTWLAWTVYGLFRNWLGPTGPWRTVIPLARQWLDSADGRLPMTEIEAVYPALLSELARVTRGSLARLLAARGVMVERARIELTSPRAEPALSPGESFWSIGGLAASGQNASICIFRQNGDVALRGICFPSEDEPTLKVIVDGILAAPKPPAVGGSVESVDQLVPLGPMLRAGVENTEALRQEVARSLYQRLVLANVRAVTAFPAERVALSTFALELASTRLSALGDLLDADEDLSALARLKSQISVVPWPVRDAIELAARTGRDERGRGLLPELALELESIMDGRILVSSNGRVVFEPTSAGGREVDMAAASTLVKSLASLAFHLRHRSAHGDLLVIDEPELNLHPDNQRKIGRFLARMVNAGIRLVVTTHSDLIIQELSNLVQLGEAGDRGRELATELGYAENQLLRTEQVGVTLCAEGTLKAIDVTRDGFSIPTMDDAIGDLDYLSQRIYGALHES